MNIIKCFFLKISMFFSLLMSLGEMDSVFLCEFDFGSWLRFHLLEELFLVSIPGLTMPLLVLISASMH